MTANLAPLAPTKQRTTKDSYKALVLKYFKRCSDPAYADQRLGQLWFNTLASQDESMAEALLDSPHDPFYDDTKLWDAVDWTMRNWDDYHKV